MDASLHEKEKKQKTTLAILTYDDGKRIFRGNRKNFVDLIKTGEDHGVDVYVTTTDELKLSGSQIVGYTYDEVHKKWKKGLVPLPNVVYNRIPFRKFELLPEVQQTIQSCLKHGKIHFFNPAFYNKWTLFEWLSKSKDTKAIVPVTQKLTNSDELEKMLQKHKSLYLKPVRGKAGKGIMKVSYRNGKNQTGEYQLSIQEKTRSHISRHSSVQQLWSQIREMSSGKDYIMQQAIQLAHYKQRPFDLRALIQKNAKGEWSVAGVGARLAGKRSITTHVPRGGSIDNPLKLLSATFGLGGSRKIIKQTKQTAIILAKQIEKASGQTIGEMSMDLGVDTSGNIWFFEANAKPMKFDEPHIRKRSLQNLIRYSLFLSGNKKAKRSPETAAARKKTVNLRSRKPNALTQKILAAIKI
ncbi:YheC/YheD family protein [Paenibacillus thalictri]|uniref:YheC/YheD family protein n=1 Tax=Paenibacillus thalictri TaxID=2527873 RepID=A0A4V2J3Q6_9BACL|nr:YheC/YheD family protein [Paenibacillus thalictri]